MGEDQNSIKHKTDNTERLKTEIEFTSVKLFEDLNFEKHDEIAEIAKIEIRLEALGI